MKIEFNLSSVVASQYSKELVSHNNRDNSDEKLKFLADSIKANTGLAQKHLLPLQHLARETNCIISFRPVDNLATELIESGYPTKGFYIKGKSASWGPQAGFICEDQRFSKLEDASAACINKFNLQVKRCIREKHAVSVKLAISRRRLNNLAKKHVIDAILFAGDSGTCSFKAKGPSGKIYLFQAKKLLGSDDDVYVVSHDNEPIRVLAPAVGARAFTADYDLLIISPHISDYGSQDKLPVPDIAHEVFRQRLASYPNDQSVDHRLIEDYVSPASFYKKEDPDIGNASQRVRLMIDLINERLVGDGEKVVHHNMDCSSPATNLSVNYPATFALPIEIGRFNQLCVINNNDELKELIREARIFGYYIKINPLWERKIGKIKAQNVEYSRALLLRKLTLNSRKFLNPKRPMGMGRTD